MLKWLKKIIPQIINKLRDLSKLCCQPDSVTEEGSNVEFEQVSKKLRRWDKHDKDMQSLALGVLMASGAATARAIYSRPTVKSTFESLVKKFFTGKWEEQVSLDVVNHQADRIIDLLKSNGVTPNKLAVDGLPGSGKSTLARALADKLGFQWKSLDHQNLNKPIDFTEGKTVYEHHRLLRTQNPDNFDAVIYIYEPVELAKERVVKRKRIPIIVDVLDFEKLKQMGDKAFALCNGLTHDIPDTNLKVKIKPNDGFKAYENIFSELSALGLNPEGLSKEQLLFLSIDGKARQGLNAYINTSVYNQELLIGLTAGLNELLRTKKDD